MNNNTIIPDWLIIAIIIAAVLAVVCFVVAARLRRPLVKEFREEADGVITFINNSNRWNKHDAEKAAVFLSNLEKRSFNRETKNIHYEVLCLWLAKFNDLYN